MKIVTILGARLQFIKASSMSREIAKYNEIKIHKYDYVLGIEMVNHHIVQELLKR